MGGAFALGQIGLLACWSVRLREPSFFRALACVCLACTIVAGLATMRVSGDPTRCDGMDLDGRRDRLPGGDRPGLASRRPGPPIGRDQGAWILAVGLAIPVALVGRPLVQESQFQPARSVSDAVKAELLESGVHRPHVAIQTGSPEQFMPPRLSYCSCTRQTLHCQWTACG